MWLIFEFYFLIFLGVSCDSVVLEPSHEVTVQITQGTVLGSQTKDGDYYEFYGIPYADSTSGTNRFKAPNPPPSFKDIFIADRKNIKCVRSLGVGYEGTEDCLVVNIFTPALPSKATKKMPVMVWVKGKEFEKYEYELSFKNFMQEEIVVVSLNFREFILGFLCLGTDIAPGNAGLKDVIAGLKWVKENIANFGGDPESVTLFGHGSGAAAVDLVSLSPMAVGLVHKIISQSGTASAPWAVTRDNMNYAVKVAEALGHTVETVEELSEVYTRTSIGALMAVINELELTDNSLAFSPCVEKTLENSVPFMVQSPQEAIRQGEFLQVPFLTGFVDNEGTIRAEEALKDDWLDKMSTNFLDFLQPDLDFDDNSEQSLIADKIKAYYFENSIVDVEDYVSYHGDTMILVSTIREVQKRATHSKAPIYLYQFSYKGPLGEPFMGPLQVKSAAHSEELAYMFYGSSESINSKDLTVSDILLERWTNFAKTGNPTSSISKIEWRPYTNKDTFYLRFLDFAKYDGPMLDVELMDPHKDKMDFWNEIYDEHFLDARSSWDLPNRAEGSGDGESVEVDPDESEPAVTEPSETKPEETDPDVTDPDESKPDETNPDIPNSASTAIAYTFTIMASFAVLNYLNGEIILS